MWELDCEESWAPKNWCFWTVVLEKTLESPLDCKEIQPVHPKGDQSWVFVGRIDAEAETLVLWPPDGKSWLIGKDPDAGKDWGQKVKGMTEDEIVGWHHWHNGHEFEQVLGDGEWTGRPGILRFMGLQRDRRDWATELNWTELSFTSLTTIHTWVLYFLWLYLLGPVYVCVCLCVCLYFPITLWTPPVSVQTWLLLAWTPLFL